MFDVVNFKGKLFDTLSALENLFFMASENMSIDISFARRVNQACLNKKREESIIFTWEKVMSIYCQAQTNPNPTQFGLR